MPSPTTIAQCSCAGRAHGLGLGWSVVTSWALRMRSRDYSRYADRIGCRFSKNMTPRGSSLVLDMLVKSKARCIDVPVAVDERFQARQLGFRDLRQLKHLLDRRFGNYSHSSNSAMVGASGMFIDLTFYALLQWLLSFTWLASTQAALFGGFGHLATARVLAIGIALVWNFTLNRRLTFNDARKGDVVRQFMTYVMSNAIAILVSLTLSLYLPAQVPFSRGTG